MARWLIAVLLLAGRFSLSRHTRVRAGNATKLPGSCVRESLTLGASIIVALGFQIVLLTHSMVRTCRSDQWASSPAFRTYRSTLPPRWFTENLFVLDRGRLTLFGHRRQSEARH